MKKILAFLLFVSAHAYGLDLIRYSLDMGVGYQAGWIWWYADQIAPAGMARQASAAASTNATGIVTLGQTLPAGTYKAYVKVVSNNSLGTPNMIAGLQAAGGPIAMSYMEDDDDDVYWNSIGNLVVPSPVTQLTFYWHTINGVNLSPQKSFVAIFLSNDPADFFLTGDDYKQVWVKPTTTDTSPPIPGNLLPNSSFENGLDGWSLFPNTKVFYSPRDTVTTNDHHSGLKCITFPNLPLNGTAESILELTSMPMLTRPNKAHSLSVWARSVPAGGHVELTIKPAVVTNNALGLPFQEIHKSGQFNLTTNWTRYTLVNKVLEEYPAPAQFYVELDFSPTGSAADTQYYIDSIQFEEGPLATDYAPAHNFEVGVEFGPPGSTYYVDETNSIVNVVVTSGLDAPPPQTLTLVYQVSNRFFTNLIAVTNTVAFSSPRTVFPVNCNNLQLGPLRIAAWLSNGAETEGYFSRIKRPRDLPRGEGKFGDHLEQWWGNMQLAKRRGYTFSRVFSPAGRFRWSLFEPTQDNFDFDKADPTLDMILQETEAFCNLYQSRAAWADRQYLRLAAPASGPGYQVGEVVTQNSSTAAGTVTWAGNASNITGYAVQLSPTSGVQFTLGGTLTGGLSGTISEITYVAPVLSGRKSPSIPDYTNYIATLIQRYTNKFFAYEVMNEPDKDTLLPKPNNLLGVATTIEDFRFYCEVLHQSVKAAKAVYPEVKLIGGSGISETNFWKWIWELSPEYVKTNLYATSVHLYEANSFRAENFINLSILSNAPPVWMTEGGVFNFSQYYGCRAAWRNNGFPLLPFRDGEDFMRVWNEAFALGPVNLIECLNAGIARIFAYDYRNYHHYGDPEAYNVQYTGVDLQESQKPTDAANSFVIASLDGGRGVLPRPVTPTGTKAYFFQAPWNEPWMCIRDVNTVTVNANAFPPTRTNRVMNWGLNNVETYSIQGNLLGMSNIISYDMMPLLIKGVNGTTIEQMQTALAGASFSVLPDTTAPNITICEYPKGPVSGLRNHRLRIRWLAWDNFYTTRQFFNVVNTRYKVDSGPFSAWDQLSFVEFPQTEFLTRRAEPRLAPGPHTFTLEARDVAGNTATNTISVTIL